MIEMWAGSCLALFTRPLMAIQSSSFALKRADGIRLLKNCGVEFLSSCLLQEHRESPLAY